MPRKDASDSTDEENIDLTNQATDERRAVRRLDKRHGFLAQIQSIQYSRDDYEQEYQQKRKEREMIVAKEKEEKERKAKESEDAERTKKFSSFKREQTRADVVAHWGHEGFVEQQKEEARSSRRPPRAERTDNKIGDRSGYLEEWQKEKLVPVRKQVKLRPLSGPYVPPKRTEMTMESSPIPKISAKSSGEKIKKGRGHSPNTEYAAEPDADLSRLSLKDSDKYSRRSGNCDMKHDGSFDAGHTRIVKGYPSEERRSERADSRDQENEKHVQRTESTLRPERHSHNQCSHREEMRPETRGKLLIGGRVDKLCDRHECVWSSDDSSCYDHSHWSVSERHSHDSIKESYERRERRSSRPLEYGERNTQRPDDGSCAHNVDRCSICVECHREDRFVESYVRRESALREARYCSRITERHARQEVYGQDRESACCCNDSFKGEHKPALKDTVLSKCVCSQTQCKEVTTSPVHIVDSSEKKQEGRKEKKKKTSEKKKKTSDKKTSEKKKKTSDKKKKASKKKKKTTTKKDCEPCLIMKIDLGKGVHKDLKYYEGEDPGESALAFCEKYNFGGQKQKQCAEALASHIRENLIGPETQR